MFESRVMTSLVLDYMEAKQPARSGARRHESLTPDRRALGARTEPQLEADLRRQIRQVHGDRRVVVELE